MSKLEQSSINSFAAYMLRIGGGLVESGSGTGVVRDFSNQAQHRSVSALDHIWLRRVQVLGKNRLKVEEYSLKL